MKHRDLTFALAVVCGATLPMLSLAQFDTGGGSFTSSDSSLSNFKFNPKTKIKLDFRNANIDFVIDAFTKASGITIVKDPSLTGPISVTSAGALGLKDAFSVLEKTLDLKGYSTSKDGNLIIIKKKDQGRGGGGGWGGGNTGFNPAMMQGLIPEEGKLKIYPIKYANATQVSRVVNEVFAGSGQSTNPFASMMQGMGGGSPFGGGGRGGRFGGGTGGFNFGGFGGQRTSGASNIRASSDDFSNSVIVNAPDKQQLEVERVIRTIDKETDQPQRTKVFKLQFATSQEVVQTVQNVLTNNAPRGRGGTTASGSNVQDRFQQAIRFGGTQAAFGTVVADNRTNSLVVTATDESMLIAESVIKELDKPVEFQDTTFVFPLENARADEIANLINQSFGQRQGVNRNNRVQTPNAQRQAGQQQRNGANGIAGGLRGGVEDPNNLFLDMANPDSASGELFTNVYAQGGGFFGGFGGQGGGFNRQGLNNQQGLQTQLGRTSGGQLAPIRDLTGQVTAIPDPNTNSLIVVANPDYAALLKQILGQLDRIPEQVMIETIIVEASLDATNRFGIEWNYTDGAHLGVNGQRGQIGTAYNLNTTQNPATGFKYTISGQNLTSFLNAVQTDTKFNVLSTPRIFTSNNTQAQINISQSIPFITNSRQDVNGGQIFNYDFTDVGVVLTVTPRITSNGYVTMDINQTANDLQGFTNFNAPIINQREADTVVSVKNGETIILGGIIRNTVTATTNKVPILGDIPLLGKLFQSQSKVSNKTELIVLLTPRIVRDDKDARKIREEVTKQLSPESQKELSRAIPPEVVKTEVKDKDKKSGGK
jgi:general secretion pathway protein D